MCLAATISIRTDTVMYRLCTTRLFRNRLDRIRLPSLYRPLHHDTKPTQDTNAFRSVRFSGPIKLDPSITSKNDTSIKPDDLVHWDRHDKSIKYNVDYREMVNSNMNEVRPGDFVEIRRSGRTFCGVAMPTMDDEEFSKTGKMDMIAVLVATGEMELVKSTDVMLHFPFLVDKELALAAAPLKRDHVLATRAAEVNARNNEQANTQMALSPEREPVDETRFRIRAQICYKIRLLQRRTDAEIRRLYPSFRTMMLQARVAEDVVSSEYKNKMTTKDESQLLHEANELLRRGNITTIECATLVFKHNRGVRHYTNAQSYRMKAESIFAVHVLLMSHPMQFIADTLSHRRSQLFKYRSITEQKNLLRVIDWVQNALYVPSGHDVDDMLAVQTEAKEIIDGFCKRARHVITWASNEDVVTAAIGERNFDSQGEATRVQKQIPALNGHGTFEWTQTDKEIIAFLKVSLGNRREIQEDPTKSVTMSIIKLAGAHVHLDPITHGSMLDAPLKVKNMDLIRVKIDTQRAQPIEDTVTGVQDGGYDLQQALVYNFLVRIGALAPWENPNSLDMYLKDYDAAEMEYKHKHSTKERLALIPEQEEQRHDFGDTPVYVIDSETASELDDGVSVVPTSNKDQYWVHVHIADPTAWIEPKSPLAMLAETRYTSIYFPEEHYSMIPTDLVMERMSLTLPRDAYGNEGQRVLTFSARVCIADGKVLDFEIKPGLVHNVKILKYDMVNTLYLNQNHPQCTPAPLDDTASQQDLFTLARIASKLQRRRAAAGAVFTEMPKFDLSVSPIPLPMVRETTPTYPMFFSGAPEVMLDISSDSGEMLTTGTFDGLPGGISAETMVSELMILSGRVAASHGIERKVPLPFRIQESPTPTEMKIIESAKHPDTAALPITTLQQNQIFLPSAMFTPEPMQHYALGIKPMEKSAAGSDALYHGGYVRSTSPLRRYSDMLSHWQLKASLGLGKIPFRISKLTKTLPRFDRMESWAKQIEKSTVKYWTWVRVAQLLHKKDVLESEGKDLSIYLNVQDQMLLHHLPAVVGASDLRMDHDSLQTKIRCNVLPLGGASVDVIWPPHKIVPPRGTPLKVKIDSAIAANTKRTLLFKQ